MILKFEGWLVVRCFGFWVGDIVLEVNGEKIEKIK